MSIVIDKQVKAIIAKPQEWRMFANIFKSSIVSVTKSIYLTPLFSHNTQNMIELKYAKFIWYNSISNNAS